MGLELEQEMKQGCQYALLCKVFLRKEDGEPKAESPGGEARANGGKLTFGVGNASSSSSVRSPSSIGGRSSSPRRIVPGPRSVRFLSLWGVRTWSWKRRWAGSRMGTEVSDELGRRS